MHSRNPGSEADDAAAKALAASSAAGSIVTGPPCTAVLVSSCPAPLCGGGAAHLILVFPLGPDERKARMWSKLTVDSERKKSGTVLIPTPATHVLPHAPVQTPVRLRWILHCEAGSDAPRPLGSGSGSGSDGPHGCPCSSRPAGLNLKLNKKVGEAKSGGQANDPP